VLDVVPRTLADGLRATLGERNFPIIANQVEAIWTVSEEAIVRAMRLVWDRLKLIVEPSSAVAVAAVLEQRPALRGFRLGVILTGGNVDLDALPFARGSA
jgi:threonine dehydratase